ncbi:hypothetical protein PSAC2689_220087 [Paraburkholderia sacchari]
MPVQAMLLRCRGARYKIRPKKRSKRGRSIRYASRQYSDLTFDNLPMRDLYSSPAAALRDALRHAVECGGMAR